MYELINTSVPNGLIAGTHGFATVAMTKGMPDAIRQRVENFCAYPHRTSAHDASYFSENPVNWFHLMLPGGDHVVGRTAPAEFDYTGRTNRISHVLCFSAREMPINGGAYVLTAESNRFCDGWSGDPKYLAVDKVTYGRLQLGARPSGTEPTHWVQMFGADGKAYAQKFAALLEQNMRTSRGIYFKASKADSDGKRLLGLFADLINILPDEIAAQVTFSTFATCVPNGVACHLRGIYDKDRAFEIASALQPWVDCESCCVKHPEMLPQLIEKKSILTTDTRTSSAGEKVSSVRPDLRIRRDRTDARESQRGVGRSYRHEPTPSQLPKYLMFGGVLFLLVVVVGLYVFEPWKTKSDPGDKYSIAQIQKDKLDLWYCARTNEIAKCQIKFVECETSSEAMQLLELVKEKQRSLQSSLENEGLANYHTQLHEVKGKYDDLIAGLQSKLEKLKEAERQKIAEEKKRKDDEGKRRASDAKAKEEDAAPARKQAEEDKRNEETQKLAARSLKELSITEVVSSSKTWADKISDNIKSTLTAEGSVIYFFLSDGGIKKTIGCVKAIVKRDPRSHKETRTLVVESPEAKSSKWFVVYIPSIQKVYWQWWTTTEPIPLFAKDDTVSLSTVVFGGKNDAFELYQKFQEVVVYAISWETAEGRYRYFGTNNNLSIDRFKPNQKKLENDLETYKRMLTTKTAALGKATKELQEADGWCNEMKGFVASFNKIKEDKRNANNQKNNEKKKDEKRRLSDAMEKLKFEAYTCFSRFDYFKNKVKKAPRQNTGEKGMQRSYIELDTISAKDCDAAILQYKEKAKKHIEDLELSEASVRRTVDMKVRESKDWQAVYRGYVYTVDVMVGRLPDEVLKHFTKEEKLSLREGGPIDHILKPSGVGEE